MLVFQTWVPLFLSLCQTLLPGRCAVSQQILVVLQPESLPPPLVINMEFIRLHALITLIHTSVVSRKRRRLSSHMWKFRFSVCFSMSDCRRRDLVNRSRSSSAESIQRLQDKKGSATSDVTERRASPRHLLLSKHIFEWDAGSFRHCVLHLVNTDAHVLK